MTKHLVAVLSIYALLQLAQCRPSAPMFGTITKDIPVELPGSERINKRSAEDYFDNKPIPHTITKDIKIELPGSERIVRSAEAYIEVQPSVPTDTITRDIQVDLPGNEKINRRSVEDYETSETNDDSQEDDDYSPEYDLLGGTPFVDAQSLESNDDFEAAESSIVFHPLFVSRKRRTSRSVEEESDDELDAAENGMVFRPLFRSRNRYELKKRVRRSVEAVPVKASSEVIATDDDLEGAENVIFKPMFRRRFRPVRSAEEVKSLKGDLQEDEMDVAENGLIFRPLFRNRQRDI